jgi:integrase/recombinase XerC
VGLTDFKSDGLDATIGAVGSTPSHSRQSIMGFMDAPAPSRPSAHSSSVTINRQMVTNFLDDCRYCNLSAETINDFYRVYLTRFTDALAKSLFDVSKPDVMAFLSSLDCSPGGRHAYFRAIRAFYNWCVDEGQLERSPVEGMKAPKVPKPLRYKVPLDALDRLLEACESVRDKLIVSMLADTGMRRTELASIKVADMDTAQQTIRIWGKGAKQRVVCYGSRTAELLAQYIDGAALKDKLFGLSNYGISKVLKTLHRKTGIKCNPHSFRRTFATESVRNGVNLFYVQSLLGHESLTMTRIYAEQVNSEDAVRAYKPVLT